MGTGTLLLAGIGAGTGEPLSAPLLTSTWIAFGYLVLVGSIALFLLFLFVLGRWAASSTSYMFVLAPLVAIPVGAALASEPVSGAFVMGGALVLAGVYVSVAQPSRRAVRVAAPLPECCPPSAIDEPIRARA